MCKFIETFNEMRKEIDRVASEVPFKLTISTEGSSVNNPYYKVLKTESDKIFNVQVQRREYGKAQFFINHFTHYIEVLNLISSRYPEFKEECNKGIEKAQEILKDINERFIYSESDSIIFNDEIKAKINSLYGENKK